MQRIEFENKQWEETLVYYYAKDENLLESEFFNQIRKVETLESLNDVVTQVSMQDFEDIFKLLNLEEVVLIKAFSFQEHWDYKVSFLHCSGYYILRIWQTFA